MRAAICAVMLAMAAHSMGSAPGARWKPREIVLTFWCPPPATDTNLAQVKADGYTMTWTDLAGLEVARRHGLRSMLQEPLLTPASLDDPAKRAQLDALIEKARKNPALDAYFLTDEPSAPAFEGLGRLVQYLREKDPGRVAYINLLPTYANNEQLGTPGDTEAAYREHLSRFIKVVKPDLLSWDHYHFFKKTDGLQYFLNLAMVRRAALDSGLPFLNIIQACTIEPSWRLVNARELRWLVYTSLAYGARGISYFLHWGPLAYGGLYQDGKRMPLADVPAELNREVHALSPELMRLRTLGAYHTAPIPVGGEAVPTSAPVRVTGGEFVVGFFGAKSRATHFMVVNRSYRLPAEAEIRLPAGVRGLMELDRRTGQWVAGPSVIDGKATVDVDAGDGRLFRL